MNTKIINGKIYTKMIQNGAANLNQYRAYVNNLNVFPVPDGDTGDNMYLTILGGAKEGTKEETESLFEAAKKIGRGTLLNARGNSGVILSRIFAGLEKGFGEKEELPVRDFGAVLMEGIEEAYRAVSKPVEGTILSVYRDGATIGRGKCESAEDFESLLDDIVTEMKASLKRTPELLPLLKEAGVVDSGAAGLLYIFEGMRKALDNELVQSPEVNVSESAGELDFDAFTADSELTFGYCTEFLLRLQNKKCDIGSFSVDELTAWLETIGNSVVAFHDGSIVKVHVHTMDPGTVLTHCRQYGEFLKIKIENMNLQHNETVREEKSPEIKKHCKYGFVAVAAGEGMEKLFREVGASAVVSGGQSMNPSAASFIEAFETLNCDSIIVLPNNSNVRMAAEQAAGMYTKNPVYIVPTRSVGEGYMALSMADTEEANPETLVRDLTETAKTVQTGYVSKATRTTVMDGVSIQKDDYIGFTDEKIYTDGSDRALVAEDLLEKIQAGKKDILLILTGEGVSEEEAKNLRSMAEKKYKNAEVFVQNGRQPIYPYIFVLT